MRARQISRSLGAAAFVLASISLSGAARAQGSEPDVERLVGVYRFVGGQNETREVERAIDEGVDELNVLIRGIARRRLKGPNLPTDELRISLRNGAVTVSRTGQPAISAPSTGEMVRWRNPKNGNELEVAHRMTDDGALEQELVGVRGISRNLFALSSDGRLVVKTSIEADALPSTIRFSTTYARK